MAENKEVFVLTQMSEFTPSNKIDDKTDIIALQDGNNVRIDSEVLSQQIINKINPKFVERKEKGQPNGVATLDENGKVPSVQLPPLDFTVNEIPIDKQTPTPTKNGVFLPTQTGIYPNFGGLEYTQQEFDNNDDVRFVFIDGRFEKQVKSFGVEGEINSTDNRAVGGDKVYDYTLKDVKTIAELRTIEGEENQTIRLLGYYEAGDKPPLLYKWVSGSGVDDGGSVIVSSGGYWSALFISNEINIKDYGANSSKDNCIEYFKKVQGKIKEEGFVLIVDEDVIIKTEQEEVITINRIVSNNNSKITIDGNIQFDTDSTYNTKVSNIKIDVRNNYKNEDGEGQSNHIFYNKSTELRSYRRVEYNNILANSEVPNETGKYRTTGLIREGSFSEACFENITTRNFGSCIITNKGNSDNCTIRDVVSYNFMTCIWAQGNDYEVSNIRGINTPEQAHNWVNKNKGRGVNGGDVLLSTGDRYYVSNIVAINPVERCIYLQGSNIVAENLYCLNGDGFKIVGVSYEDLGYNNSLTNFTQEYDVNFNTTFNTTPLQIYWCDNYYIRDGRVVNKSGKTSCIISLYSFKRMAKNVSISNIEMKETGTSSAIGLFQNKSDYSEDILYENIEIRNIKAIRGSGRVSSSMNNPTTTVDREYIKNMTISECEIEYQKITSTGDDFLYTFDGVDTMKCKNNRSNTTGHWRGGFPPNIGEKYRNIEIEEKYLKADDVTININTISKIKNIKQNSILVFEASNRVLITHYFNGVDNYKTKVHKTDPTKTELKVDNKTVEVNIKTKNSVKSVIIVNNNLNTITDIGSTDVFSYIDNKVVIDGAKEDKYEAEIIIYN